jgi:hypothetical protein
MAKKQSMNPIEAHMEKIAIGAAGLVFIWVLVTRFILASGIESGGTVQSVDKAATEAGQRADAQVDSMKQKSGTPRPNPVPPPQDPTEVEPFIVAVNDRIPLGPSNDTKMINREVRAKIENFPKQFVAPQNLAVGIYHTRAAAPSASIVNTGGLEAQDQEVDFVTVEATFPMKQLRSQFQLAFANPKLEEDPVEHPDPIITAVELQRSQLLPTGSWSAWQKIPRLDIEPGAVSELASEDFAEYSLQKFKTILEVRGEYATQKRVLQPEPYTLVTEVWLNPSEKAKVQEQKPDARTPAGAGLANRRVRPAPGAADRGGRRSPAPRRGGGESNYYGGEEDSSYYGGGEPGYGPSRRDRGRGDYSGGYGPGVRPARRATSLENTEAKKYLEEDEVTLWAHDGTVVPGVVYRYRIRLGCFNPIAGRDRFLPQDSEYKNKIILWSDYLPNTPTDYKYVRVNKRVLFFPKTASAGDKSVASVEVFRQHEGKWYLRPYSVIPGSMIGGIDPPLVKKSSRTVAPPPAPGRTTPGRRPTPGRPIPGITGRTSTNPLAQEEPEEIDFRTGITVIDITPKTDHWYSSGSANSLNKLATADLIYRDVDGFVKRIPVDSRCWPKELRDELSGIRKKMREPRPTPPGPGGRRGAAGRATDRGS